MTLAPRFAFASGAASAGACVLLLSGRIEGTAFLALLLACGARAAAAAARLGDGPVASALALRSLRRQALFAPAWGLALGAALFRGGSALLGDLRGAHAVLGLSIARGSAAAVAGAWLALAAGLLAASGPWLGRPETGGPSGTRAALPGDPRAVTLETMAFGAQAGLLATLFVGPQISGVGDALTWVLTLALLAAAAALLALPGAAMRVAATAPRAGAALARLRVPPALRPEAPLAAAVLGLLGLALTLAGGRS